MANKINYGTKSADAAYPIVDATKQWTYEDANEVKTKHNLNDDRITALENFKYGTIALGDLNSRALNYSFGVTGDISSAELTAKVDGSGSACEITVNLSTAMTNTTYFVRTFIESLGTMNLDNNLDAIVFKPISASQFKIYVQEVGTVVMDVKLHIEVIQK
jgi:hypothetical protein